MLLHKPQVYRHLLYNRLEEAPARGSGEGRDEGPTGPLLHGVARRPALSGALIKLCLLLVLFEVYIKWSKMDSSRHSPSFHSPAQFITQYLYLCGTSMAGTVPGDQGQDGLTVPRICRLSGPDRPCLRPYDGQGLYGQKVSSGSSVTGPTALRVGWTLSWRA